MPFALYTRGYLSSPAGVQSVPSQTIAEDILIGLYTEVRQVQSGADLVVYAVGADAITKTHAAVITNITPSQTAEALEVVSSSGPYVDHTGATVTATVCTYSQAPTAAANLHPITPAQAAASSQSLAFGEPGPLYIAAERAHAKYMVDKFRTMQASATLTVADALMQLLEPVLSALTAGVCGVAWSRWRTIADPASDGSWAGLPISPVDAQDLDDAFVLHFLQYPRDLS